jgi:hypothetical protein
MNFDQIQTLFTSAKNIDNIKKGIKEFIKNPENPWEQREWVWDNCPEEFMYEELFYLNYHFTDGEEVSWFDDFCKERHEVVVCRDLKGYSGWSGRKDQRNEEVEWNAFKKHCIEQGIMSFEFDW